MKKNVKMTVEEFIGNFVEPNTLIRLQHVIPGGHEEIEHVRMDWKLSASKYKNREVVGITDILYPANNYPEAVNLVIK